MPSEERLYQNNSLILSHYLNFTTINMLIMGNEAESLVAGWKIAAVVLAKLCV